MENTETMVGTIHYSNNGKVMMRMISELIRKNERQILRGESKLSLDTLSLACLNQFFAVHYEGLGTSSTNRNGLNKASVKDVEFLYQIVQKTPVMKLVHGTSTLQGTVDISRFNNLSELEIKKVPVHLLSGLKGLRHQLKVLSCTRCINTIQEVFGNHRDGDTVLEYWPHLHTLDLSFNHIETLGKLMECFPNLRSLDLSHNNIVSVEHYLKWLPKLMYLNMGYNRLKNIPELGIQGKRCLISLVVRNNNLDNLDGVEELDTLEELEASHNCIHDNKWLEVFSQLNHLAMVNLKGNPFSYEAQFRANVIGSMSAKAVKRCPIIDETPVSKEEKMLVKKKVGKRLLQKYRHSADFLESSYSPSLTDVNASINDSPKFVNKKTENKLKKPKKVRTPTISNSHTKRPTNKDKLIHEATASEYRSELDRMRQHHGPDWLNAVNIKTDESSTDDGISNKKTTKDKNAAKDKKTQNGNDVPDGPSKLPSLQMQKERILSVDEGDDICGPLLVRIEDRTTGSLKHVFLTVREVFIQEKDLDGEVIDKLDLRALKSISRGNETVLDEESGRQLIIPSVHLAFDYTRKDRQRRDYLMDDVNDSKILLDALEPMLEQNQMSVIIRNRMQCLKCSLEFNKGDADKAVQKKRKDKSLLSNDIDSIIEVFVCPTCKSDLLVEMDTMQWEDQRLPVSASSTPFGSITSINSALPLAASSPWKQPGSSDHPFVRSLDSASTDFHTPDSSPVSSFIPNNRSSSSTVTQTHVNSQSNKTSSMNHNDEVLLEKECAPLERQLKEEIIDHVPNLPIQDIPEYPHEKIEELIENNKKEKFHSHYSLVPSNILGSNTSSRQSSRSNSVNETPPVVYQIPRTNSVLQNSRVKHSLFGKDDANSGRNSIDSDIMVLHQNGNAVEIDNGLPIDLASSSGLVKALNSGSENHSDDLEASTSSGNTPYGSLLESFSSSRPFISDSENGDTKVVRPSGATISSTCNNNLGTYSLEATPFGTPSSINPSTHELGGLSDYLSGTESQINNGYSTANSDHISDPDDQSGLSVASKKLEDDEEESAIAVDENDHSFTTIDHRLKLYFSMSLFGDVEEFACMLKGPIFQHNKLIEFAGLLVVSTSTIFIMKITKKESDNPSDWLFKKSQHPIKDLRHLHVGLGSQCLQLEFNTEVSVYTVQIKDRIRCEQFVHCLLDTIENCDNAKRFAGVSRDDALTSLNLLEAVHSSDANESIDEDSTLRTYLIGNLKTYQTIKNVCQPVETTSSIVVTTNEFCLLDENYFWPLNSKNSIPPKMVQFTVKQIELISNISGIVLYKDSENDISVGFFNEGSGEESYWHLKMETKSSLRSLISALKEPWEKVFGVDLQCTEYPSIIIQEEM
ncbi:serine/threonine-protein kinase 11-interacting protein-like isoform X2 [Antedon mediterranea]|uniref:serine/threonine-protein kinase 11-interacting protein-like isoform X2 n=1 Tax=Antedon mediterranea TaxID=105859 RepID=UPI003AF46000